MGLKTPKTDMKTTAFTPSTTPKELPLVVALNCLQDTAIERLMLDGVARVESIVGHSKAHLSLIEEATVIIVLSLNDLSSAAQGLVSSAELVVCIGSGSPQLEAAIAEDLRIQRLVHVNVQLVDEAADTTLALTLALLRRTHVLAQCCQRGIWAPSPTLLRGSRRCNGLTLGLLGLDNVALAVAQRAIGFGFLMTFYDPLKDRDKEEAAEWAHAAEVAGLVPVHSVTELVQSCDVLSIHCSSCEETMGLLDKTAMSHFKPGALLVNTSSSELVDEDALRRALLDGSLSGAALDTVDSPAWFEAWVRDIPNLIMTPRCACYSDQAFAEQRSRGATVVQRFLKDGAIKGAGQEDPSPSPAGTPPKPAPAKDLPIPPSTPSKASPDKNPPSKASPMPAVVRPPAEDNNKTPELETVAPPQEPEPAADAPKKSTDKSTDENKAGEKEKEKEKQKEKVAEPLAALKSNSGQQDEVGELGVLPPTPPLPALFESKPSIPMPSVPALFGGTSAAPPAPPSALFGSMPEDGFPLPMLFGEMPMYKTVQSLDGASDTSSEVSSQTDNGKVVRTSMGNMGPMAEVPEQLQEGMVVALVVVTAPPAAATCAAAAAGGGGGGGWWSPAVAVAAAVVKRRSVSFDLPVGDGKAPSEAKVLPEAGAGAEEGDREYYGLRMDAERKLWRLEAVPGLTKADPAAQLIVIRRKNTIGFRAGLAAGKVLQMTRAKEMLFSNHNFGSWESWHMAMDGAETFVLTNKKWKDQRLVVKIEVVGELINGIVRLKGAAPC